MNKYLKTFLGLLIILVPVILTLGIFFNKLTKKSFYENNGEIKVSGLKSKVKVYSDEYGVPHIIAENEGDLYFTLGYMHAQNRLWQMDITRRAAEGRLSQILGNSVLDYDKMFRTIGIDKFSYRLYYNISQKSKEILQEYANGVNKFIEMHREELPVEFDILNYRPEPWKPQESLMTVRLMAWELNINWYADYVFREITDKVGIEKVAEIFPDTSIGVYKKPKPSEPDSIKSQIQPMQRAGSKDFSAVGDFFEVFERYRNFFNINSLHSGSNAWVVEGEKSESGKPILANDPHLNFQSPSKWYEIHLKSSDIDVTGMTIPGVPAVAIGHNRMICWGLTNLMNDDNDFVLLDRDSADVSKYRYKNQSYYMDSVVEKIEVKDSSEVEYTVKYTKIGPIISGILKNDSAGDEAENDKNFSKGRIVTFRWTGYEYSDEPECFYKINTARNWEDFKNALKGFGVPAQNFIYADTAGNIGYHAGGKVPIRKSNTGYYPYFAEDEEWTGFIEFERLPNTYNPEEGFIVTANTNPFEWLKTESAKRYYISWGWEPSSRYDKIKDILQNRAMFNINEFELMQMNYQSLYAKEFSKYIVEAYKENVNGSKEVTEALDRMKNWNGEIKPDSPEGSIFNTFFMFLLKNVYYDELGEKIFYDFLKVTNFPFRATMILVRNYNASTPGWFDNVNTPAAETRDEIIRKSFYEAVSFLKAKYSNPDVNSWKWGEIHKVKFKHLLGIVPALDKTFNIGPFEVGGDQTTINNSEYSFIKAIKEGTFENDLGPSMRMITDLSDVAHSLSVNSTGQSGQPLHPDYNDQSRLWLYGDYKEITMNELEMIDKRYSLLLLLPDR